MNKIAVDTFLGYKFVSNPVVSPKILGPRILPSNCCRTKMKIANGITFFGSESRMSTPLGIAPINGPKNGITFVNLVDKEGNFVPEVEPWAGRFVRDCNEDICKWLAEENKLFSKEKIKCYRC